MCGRYTLTKTPRELAGRFNAKLIAEALKPRFNIAPGQMVPVVIARAGDSGADQPVRELLEMKWGLVPFWAADKKMKPMINARAETLAEKPTFKKALMMRRCLVLADGFYEWKTTPTGKVPMRVYLKGNDSYAFAGLWDQWTSEDGEVVQTCTIITVPPASSISHIHNRMPAILSREAEDLWLSTSVTDKEKLLELLKPYADAEIEFHSVSKLVNSSSVDSEDCIQRAPDQG